MSTDISHSITSSIPDATEEDSLAPDITEATAETSFDATSSYRVSSESRTEVTDVAEATISAVTFSTAITTTRMGTTTDPESSSGSSTGGHGITAGSSTSISTHTGSAAASSQPNSPSPTAALTDIAVTSRAASTKGDITTEPSVTTQKTSQPFSEVSTDVTTASTTDGGLSKGAIAGIVVGVVAFVAVVLVVVIVIWRRQKKTQRRQSQEDDFKLEIAKGGADRSSQKKQRKGDKKGKALAPKIYFQSEDDKSRNDEYSEDPGMEHTDDLTMDETGADPPESDILRHKNGNSRVSTTQRALNAESRYSLGFLDMNTSDKEDNEVTAGTFGKLSTANTFTANN